MPTTRTPIHRRQIRQLGPEAIEAWAACDYRALHIALGLSPAHASPLPYEIHVNGVADDDFDQHRGDTIGPGPFSRSLKKAVKLQRQLLRVAGYPRDARRAIEENLAKAVRDRDLAREAITRPAARSVLTATRRHGRSGWRPAKAGSLTTARTLIGLPRCRRLQREKAPARERYGRDAIIGLTDQQLAAVMERARVLPPSARPEYLQLIANELKIRDGDVAEAADRAVRLLLECRGDNPNVRKPVMHL
jgi:hypothetical protein